MKKENETLKTDIKQNEEIIKKLNAKIKVNEEDINNLTNALTDSSDKFNEEITKRSEDLEFYKKSYEEQKSRVNKEHELISASLYDLALQFITLKNELQKKISVNNNSNNNNNNEN